MEEFEVTLENKPSEPKAEQPKSAEAMEDVLKHIEDLKAKQAVNPPDKAVGISRESAEQRNLKDVEVAKVAAAAGVETGTQPKKGADAGQEALKQAMDKVEGEAVQRMEQEIEVMAKAMGEAGKALESVATQAETTLGGLKAGEAPKAEKPATAVGEAPPVLTAAAPPKAEVTPPPRAEIAPAKPMARAA